MFLSLFLLPLIASLLLAIAVFCVARYTTVLLAVHHPFSFWPRLDALPVYPLFIRFGQEHRLSTLLETAGLPPDWKTQRFLILKQLTVIIIVLILGYAVWTSAAWNRLMLPAIILLAISWLWPELYLKRRVVFRKRQALKTLGSVIDLLRLQVESGSNLESAIRHLAEGRQDLWGYELSRTMFLLDRGVAFDEALDALTRRFGMDDVNRLVLAIKQSKLLGASLSDTLTIQSDMLRTRRRQQAEEKARLASVKIALPLVFFIFPALLIIYLAPAVLHILQSF
ncbi:MAG: type II secretion system F family protein [Candidatus Uhrbacteria bacterium]|nr:type II secretion system F family protein [Candidatus Uhrbacteria bacterium]MDP3793211.1 type II secretion system F family protein [Candidatus Uhrbacteria bacterium]